MRTLIGGWVLLITAIRALFRRPMPAAGSLLFFALIFQAAAHLCHPFGYQGGGGLHRSSCGLLDLLLYRRIPEGVPRSGHHVGQCASQGAKGLRDFFPGRPFRRSFLVARAKAAPKRIELFTGFPPTRPVRFGALTIAIEILVGFTLTIRCVAHTIFGMFVHLLDGTYELFRAYFGFPSRKAPDGREVGAVYGLLNTTLSLLRDPRLSHIAAATDTVIESFRNDLYPGYKTGAGIPADLMAQFGLAERAFRALGVTVWGMIEFEADDAMASGAHRFSPQAERVILVSPDKDLTQCVSGRQIVTFDRRQNRMLDADGVMAKFGVAPASIPDYLALVGDSADGIPGIPAWGAKSSAAVLGHYLHLEFIPPDPRSWEVAVRGAARLSRNLNERQDDAILFRELTTLRRDAPISRALEEIAWRGVNRVEYESLCTELGFRNPPSVHRWDGET